MFIFKIATGFIVWNVFSFLCLVGLFSAIILVTMSLVMKPRLERSENEERPSFQVYMADFYLEKLFKHFIATLFLKPRKAVQFQAMIVFAIFVGLVCAVI